MYKIRKASVEDVDLFYSFFIKSITTEFPEYTEKTKKFFLEEDYSKTAIEKGIKEKKFNLFLAVDNNKVVAYLLATKTYGGVAFCNWITVDKEYQKQGIGTSLLHTWEKYALEEGAHKLHLWTGGRNRDFYKHQGFVLLGEISDDYYGADDYFFYKALRKSEENNYLKQ